MADICGLPAECKDNYATCTKINVKPFQCGMKADKNGYPTDISGAANIGKAGEAILAFREADANLAIAQADLKAIDDKINIAIANAENYKNTIESLHLKRQNLTDTQNFIIFFMSLTARL